MGIIGGLWLMVLGALAVPNAILAKQPDAKRVFDKLQPWQEWMGVLAVLWGIYAVVQAIVDLQWIRTAPIYWATHTVAALLQIALGVLLGFSLVRGVLPKEAWRKRIGELRFKLATVEGQVGVAGIFVGGLLLVVYIFAGPR